MTIEGRIVRMLYKAVLGDLYVTHARRDSRKLALTFDDGPDPTYTTAILDLLAQHGVRATFFLTGVQAESFPHIVSRTISEGHEIGNHSYGHNSFAVLPIEAQLDEIEHTDEILKSHDQRDWHWFRPPQGILPIPLFLKLRSRRHPVAMWSYDSRDYRKLGAESIVHRFSTLPARGGEVLLFHDDNGHTLDALQLLIPLWIRDGYAFDTLTALHPLRREGVQ